MTHDYLLDGESEERILYLARIGAIFERLYGIKDLHDAESRARANAGVTAKMLAELGYSSEQIETILRERLLFYKKLTSGSLGGFD